MHACPTLPDIGAERERHTRLRCRPVHHRIPNFKGADKAAERLAGLEEFERAQFIKCNPDTPQKMVGGVDAALLPAGRLLAAASWG